MNATTPHDIPIPGPVDVVVYHVGGEGGIGPVETAFEAAADNVMLVVFEIRDDKVPFVVQQAKHSPKQFTIKVNRAVDAQEAEREFYVTDHPLSSSLYKPSPMASSEDPNYFHCLTWGDNTTIKKTIKVHTTSIEAVIDELKLPPPDVISSDAQGAELSILKGAGRFLPNLLGAVTEVEFSEIYHRQPLFDEQMALLSPLGLRLVNLFNSQIWQPGPRMRGTGFLTVAEAVFLKYFHVFGPDDERPARGYAEMKDASTEALMKTIILAMGFRLLSYAVKIATFIKAERSNYQQHIDNVPVLKSAFALADFVAENRHQMSEKLDFFIDTITMPESRHMTYMVQDTSSIQWEDLKKRRGGSPRGFVPLTKPGL